MQALTTLFVYGTLKRGDVRAYLLDGQRYIGEAQSTAAYRLFNTGDYPAMVQARPLGLPCLSIVGELWEVDASCLARLDEEEGVAEGLYARQRIELVGEHAGAQVQTYLYRLSVEGLSDCGSCWAAG